MAKTLNKILELYKPKAGDEQKFVAKHVVAKTDDANKNGDDVFQATNVKKVDRKKERHGYEDGEDAKMYEEVEHSDLDEGYDEQNGEYRKEAIKHAERVLAAVKNEKLNGCKYIARNLQDMADDMENSIEMAEKYAMKEDVDVSDQSVKLLELYANLNDDNKENMIEMFDTSKDVLLSFINQEESEQDNG